MSQRKQYSREFKLEAVRLWQTTAKSAREIEADLGLTAGLLHKWKRQLQADREGAFPGHGKQPPAEETIRRLERELAIVKQERDILKKAVAIFSQPPP